MHCQLNDREERYLCMLERSSFPLFFSEEKNPGVTGRGVVDLTNKTGLINYICWLYARAQTNVRHQLATDRNEYDSPGFR